MDPSKSVQPDRWLVKNTDTFAGFAHAIGTYLAGVTLAHMNRLGLIHRPQPMAHGLGYAFEDFFAMDPRGIVPPVYAPILCVNNTSMLVNGQAVKLDVIAGGATTNATKIGERIRRAQPNSLVWLRLGRSSLPSDCANCSCRTEVRYAGLWLRERFWRAAFAWSSAHTERRSRSIKPSRKAHFVAPMNYLTLESSIQVTRIVLHVRRGDVVYFGPKTGRPHPHWVDTATVLRHSSEIVSKTQLCMAHGPSCNLTTDVHPPLMEGS